MRKTAPSIVAGIALLVGCATPPPAQHTVPALQGRIMERIEIARMPMRTSGAYKPVQLPNTGGAFGALVGGLIEHYGGDPAFTIYRVRKDDGTMHSAPSRADFKVGDCIEVLSTPAKADAVYWVLGDIALRTGVGCNE